MQATVQEHAQVVSASLWNYDKKSQAEYLSLVAKDYNYKAITVLDQDGETFLSVSTPAPNWYQKIFLSLKFVSTTALSAPIVHYGQTIGSIEVIWYHSSIHIYINLLCVFSLILIVFSFYNRLLTSKLLLEARVKERTAELQYSEQKFKLLFETADDSIFLVKDGAIIDCNKKTLEMFRCSRKEMLAHLPYDFSPLLQPDGSYSDEKAQEKVNLALEGKSQRFEWQHRKYDGTLFDAEVSINVLEIEGEKYLQAFVRDITERKKAENALKLSEEKYSTLVEQSNDIILILQDNIIRFVNNKMCKVLGYKREEIIGSRGTDFVTPTYRELVMERAEKRMAGEKVPSIYEVEIIAAEERIIPVEINVSIINYEDSPGVMIIMRDITERKLAEEALKKSERNYREIFNSTADGIFIFNAETADILDVNKTMLDMLGYSRDEISQLDINDLSSGDSPYSQQEAIEWMDKAKIEDHLVVEWLARKKNGDLFWVEVVLRRTNIGGDGRILAVVRDISERKKAEQELRKKEEQQALILRTLPMAFYVARPFGDYGGMWISDQIEALTGFTPEQFMGDTTIWSNRIHLDDKKHVIEAFEKIHETGMVSLEYRWQTAGGSYRWFHDEGVLTRDGQGKPLEIIGTWLDITERRKEQETLLITQHTVEWNTLPIVWIMLEPSVRLKYANRAACSLFGFTEEEMHDLTLGSTHPEGTIEYWQKYFPIVKKEKSLDFEVDLRTKDGSIFPAIVTATYLEFLNKEYVVLNIFDISDRKKMEKELQQAQKMEAMGTLAGGIAHDFNNILSAIFGFTELAQMDIDEPDKLRYDLEKVSDGARRARELVKQVLTFGKMTEFKKSPLQMSLIIKEALKLLRPSIPSSIEIQQQIQSDAYIFADPTQMHQIIMNLCTNAYQAMKKTGGTLTISLAEVDIEEVRTGIDSEIKSSACQKLTVSDTGHGMDRDTIGKIFEPYFTTKEKDEGTGLGLAVVHGIVTQSGGSISVESEPGQGTSFHIFMPVYEQKQTAVDFVTDDQAVLEGGTGSLMFVDDEEGIRHLATKILGKYGYTVSAFDNGYEAWQEYKKHSDRYDMVITDMTMPQMNGFELAENILRISPDMPIILCTGYSDLVNREKALDMGIKEFILKPLEVPYLLNLIKTILTRRSHGI